MRTHARLFALVLASSATAALAQEPALPEPVPEPSAAKSSSRTEPEVALDLDAIDLANLVTTAAKGVTTVQEAPAIISIITADEIKARGFRWIEEAWSTVAGWGVFQAQGQQVPAAPQVRGVGQAALLLRDGVSMFDPFGNIPAYRQNVPLESVKRIELVTGPGGVLWGANSFLGIINVVMKDADDVDGVELAAGYGDGSGFRGDFKTYALFGKTFFGGKLKLFQHVSYETYVGPTWNVPGYLISSTAPQPGGPGFFGPETEVRPERSWVVMVDGKYSLGPVSLFYQLPFASMHQALSFANASVPVNNANIYDRYAALQYQDRFWRDRFGVNVKGYWTQFVRNYNATLFPPQSQFPAFSGAAGANLGGVRFDVGEADRSLIQRAGATIDLDLQLPHGFRLLFGGELVYEAVSGLTEVITSAPYGSPGDAIGPDGKAGLVTGTPGGLPLVCPTRQQPDGSFRYEPYCPRPFVDDQYRIVTAAYADVQYRPVRQLALDAGVRLQRGLGGRPYDWTPLYSAAAVWNFVRDQHLKVNYATGFRPPVFNTTDSVAGGINFGANPTLKSEASQSFQGEWNARLLRNAKHVRELQLRVDYSYSYLSNLILIRGNRYIGSGDRAIHSVEAMSKLYLTGEHSLTASYTYLYSQSSDTGGGRNIPNHWLSLGATFCLVKQMLDVNANVLVTSAYADPNRYPSGTMPVPGATTVERTSDLTFDRLTPVALLQLGFRLRFFHERLVFSTQLYNVLNQRYWSPDPFYDLTPSQELSPTPAPGFSFYSQLSWRF